MEIEILGREEITRMLGKGLIDEGCAVVSFYDEGTEPVDLGGCGAEAFPVELDDIDSDEPGFDIDGFFPQADKAAGFIVQALSAGKRIICQCEYGMSRSAGCAAAVLEHYENSGITVFADDRYCPNKAVFRKLFDALKAAHRV